jgi:hypothetical protein
MMRGKLLVEVVVVEEELTPLLTTVDEVTGNPPREVPESPELRELVEPTTEDEETVGGVAKPASPTDPNLMVEKVMTSTCVLLMPIMVSN